MIVGGDILLAIIMVGAVQFPITQETIKKEKLLVVPSHRMCAFTNTVYGDFSHL